MPTIDDELIQNGKAVFNSQVIINSAKDLKTKDGSVFGGGEGLSKPWFSSNEYIAILSKSATTSPLDDYISGLCNIDGTVGLIAGNLLAGVSAGFIPSLTADYPIFMYQGNDVESTVQLPEEFFNTSTIINLGDINTNKAEIAKKQPTLYRHTVLISEPTNKTAYLAFTAESNKNTPIDSIQNLIAVFGNTSIACSGIYGDGDPANEQILLMINVGISISDTTISAASIENNGITDFSNALFADTFGATGFTIADNVTAM